MTDEVNILAHQLYRRIGRPGGAADALEHAGRDADSRLAAVEEAKP